jgi:hypothetical protein
MQSKKIHLLQFDIIPLSNPDLIYIRNHERNKIMLALFHLLKTYIRNPSLFFISFFTLPRTGEHRWQPRSTREEVSFAKFLFLPSCWRLIFLVLLKLDGCQVDLPNCWSYCYHVIIGVNQLVMPSFDHIIHFIFAQSELPTCQRLPRHTGVPLFRAVPFFIF